MIRCLFPAQVLLIPLPITESMNVPYHDSKVLQGIVRNRAIFQDRHRALEKASVMGDGILWKKQKQMKSTCFSEWKQLTELSRRLSEFQAVSTMALTCCSFDCWRGFALAKVFFLCLKPVSCNNKLKGFYCRERGSQHAVSPILSQTVASSFRITWLVLRKLVMQNGGVFNIICC